jgi:hypothetical protein
VPASLGENEGSSDDSDREIRESRYMQAHTVFRHHRLKGCLLTWFVQPPDTESEPRQFKLAS